MRKMMGMILAATVLSGVRVSDAAVRVETRGVAGCYLATGVERIGSADGAFMTEWDTTACEDGWWRVAVQSGGALAITRPAGNAASGAVDVLILNTTASVVGGRMSASEAWDDERVIVVRDDIVVSNGITLTLGAGCIVKFTEGARIVVEDGGEVVADGAYLAAFDDDSVGGDTDMNGYDGRDGARPSRWWLDDAAVAALATVRFVDGSTNLPTRTYSTGRVLGALPELAKNDAMFGGWFTGSGGEGERADGTKPVPPGETVLYAYWIPYELSIDPSAATVEAVATNGTFAVTANSEWEFSCDADWVVVTTDGNAVSYAVGVNESVDARTATIRVASDGGLSRDFTLTQTGMAVLAAPTINPADGTTFSGSSRRVSISGAESGAEIRYTLDGSEPTATSKLYTKSFNVFDTTVVKARAFKSGNLASATVSSRIVRLQTLAEALDVPLWTVTTSGDAAWAVAESEGRNGSSCARSGVIGDDQATTLTTAVDGAGTLTFWWKVDCEDDDSDYDNWDYLAFSVDGVEIARIDGDSGWRQVSVKLKTDAAHTLTWTYCKDYMDDDMTGIEDCGWVDQISWTPFAGDSEVPVAWLENLGMVAAGTTAADVANADPDCDGLTTAEEYIAGTDPNDPDSKLTAVIEMVDKGDGKGLQPVVTFTPDLLGERKYIKLGKVRLDDPDEKWTPVEAGEEGRFNFFKVTVELP